MLYISLSNISQSSTIFETETNNCLSHAPTPGSYSTPNLHFRRPLSEVSTFPIQRHDSSAFDKIDSVSNVPLTASLILSQTSEHLFLQKIQ